MRLNVQDDFIDNSGVYAIGWITSLPETKKPPAGHGKWSLFDFSMVLVSVYFVRNPLDDSIVGETVIPVIEH
jgi:hypothetical protein